VADINVVGRPAIYVPLAIAVRDEQTANARGPVEAGAAVLMPEAQLTPESLAAQIETILTQPEAATAMSIAALSVAVPDATDRLVALVESLSASASPKD
jgi:UDP-N-acetylglucosamine--N-acetylmuramyl-(pentapeptide) pyrophosphoryl-undecaprenol N-acetylglucosamine transferase